MGILRHERVLRTQATIKSATGVKTPFISSMTWEIARKLLNEDLTELALDKGVPALSTVLSTLKTKECITKPVNTYGNYLIIREHRDLENAELANKLGVSERTIQRYKEQLEKAGISTATLADRSIHLPPLTLPIKIPQPHQQTNPQRVVKSVAK